MYYGYNDSAQHNSTRVCTVNIELYLCWREGGKTEVARRGRPGKFGARDPRGGHAAFSFPPAASGNHGSGRNCARRGRTNLAHVTHVAGEWRAATPALLAASRQRPVVSMAMSVESIKALRAASLRHSQQFWRYLVLHKPRPRYKRHCCCVCWLPIC